MPSVSLDPNMMPNATCDMACCCDGAGSCGTSQQNLFQTWFSGRCPRGLDVAEKSQCQDDSLVSFANQESVGKIMLAIFTLFASSVGL